MNLKFQLTIQTDAATRWFVTPDELARKLAILAESLTAVWSQGSRPAVHVIRDEKFFDEN